MKDAHLTLRLPAALAAALERVAKARGAPKSMMVREAVEQYLATDGRPRERPPMLASEFAARWAERPRLDPRDVDEFERELGEARRALPGVKDPWD